MFHDVWRSHMAAHHVETYVILCPYTSCSAVYMKPEVRESFLQITFFDNVDPALLLIGGGGRGSNLDVGDCILYSIMNLFLGSFFYVVIILIIYPMFTLCTLVNLPKYAYTPPILTKKPRVFHYAFTHDRIQQSKSFTMCVL